jgi:hypothetical protein
MTPQKIAREDGGPDRYGCENCGNVWPFERLDPITDGHARNEVPAGEVPAGECPTCGALCYAATSEPTPGHLWEVAEDRCANCGKWLGHGVRFLHLGLCEDCRDAPKH